MTGMNMSMRKILYLLSVFCFLLLLCSCHKAPSISEIVIYDSTTDDGISETVSISEMVSDINTATENINVTNNSLSTSQKELSSIFEIIKGDYVLDRGSGPSFTEIKLEADGSFEGHSLYGDLSIRGDYDYAYCESVFSGKFGLPQKVDDRTYTMRLESVEYEGVVGNKRIEDGILYDTVYNGAPELSGVYFVYFPGTEVSDLPEGCRRWPYFKQDNIKVIPQGKYVIYDTVNEELYVSGTYEDY